MKRKQLFIEEELEREKKHQEKDLKTRLKQRRDKLMRQQQREKEKQLKAKDAEIGKVKEQIEKVKEEEFAKSGDIIVGKDVKEKAKSMVEKMGTVEMELDDKEKDALEIMKVQHKREREKLARALELDEEEEEKNEFNLEGLRDDYKRRIEGAADEKQKKKLIEELKRRERQMQKEMEMDQLK